MRVYRWPVLKAILEACNPHPPPRTPRPGSVEPRAGATEPPPHTPHPRRTRAPSPPAAKRSVNGTRTRRLKSKDNFLPLATYRARVCVVCPAARDFDLGGGFHYSGSYPMVFQHSGARDFDLGGGFHYSGSYPMVFQHSGPLWSTQCRSAWCVIQGRFEDPISSHI